VDLIEETFLAAHPGAVAAALGLGVPVVIGSGVPA